jgi:hypothetical protein
MESPINELNLTAEDLRFFALCGIRADADPLTMAFEDPRLEEIRMIHDDELLKTFGELFAKAVTAQEVERADKEIKEAVGQAIPVMLPELVEEAANSIQKFLTKMFDEPLSQRADSSKRRDFRILSRAACELSTAGGNEAVFDALHRGLIRAADALDRGDEEKFRARVRRAFDLAFKAGFAAGDFLALDVELKTQERRMELHRKIRRLIGKKGLRRMRRARQRRVLRQCDMSPADEKFYT